MTDDGVPLSQEWLTKLHDEAHAQPQDRAWRTVDTLVHEVDRLTLLMDQVYKSGYDTGKMHADKSATSSVAASLGVGTSA